VTEKGNKAKRILCGLALSCAGIFQCPALHAQTIPPSSAAASTSSPSPPQTCDSQAARGKVAWAQTQHVWLASLFHNESADTKQTWCSIWETHGYDRVHKTEDFGRVFFTGEGLHPALGSIVPGSGFAGGLGLTLDRALQSKPLRFAANIEARGTASGFWEAGGKLHIVGSSATDDNRHINATLFAQHRSLPELTYFGLGDSSSVVNQSVYGLEDTSGGGTISVPLPIGFTISGSVGGLHTDPEDFHGSPIPSIEQIFNPSNTPALSTSTTYIVSGAGIEWIHPVDECLHCWYRTDVATDFEVFHETGGAPYSFRRLHVNWTQTWHPFPDATHDLGTISIVSRLVESFAPAGNSVPFYLQPTIGGTDIDNYDAIRSYRDYRFRAPNALTFQGEYTRPIYDPLGFLFFYDVGKVALTRSDLDISHMRHSFGVGLTLKIGGATLFKFYYAWAGREGTHTNYTGNTNNFAGENAAAGVF
jgi:hypothetical protein